MDEKTTTNVCLEMRKIKQTEEQRKERLRIKHAKKIRKKENQKTTRGKEKVVRSRRPRETVPGHSQKIEAR